MTVELATERIRNVVQSISTGGLAVAVLTAANDARSLIFNRITQTGKDAEGNQYRPYSTKPMLTNCSAMTLSACNTIVGSKGKRKTLQWVTLDRVNKQGKRIKAFELPGGYKQFRELHGRQTNFVDFTFNGDMWKSIQVMTGMDEARQGYAIISSNDEANMKKLAGNTDRRGDILALSDAEINEISEIFEEEIMDIFRQNELV